MTNLFEIYIIELPKCKINNADNKNLIQWIEFLKNPEQLGEKDMSKEIKEAKKCLEKISKDEEEIRWAELREKYVLEINTVKVEAKEEGYNEGKEEGYEAGKEKGLKDGKREGLKEGKKEGKKEAKETIVKNMLQLNFDIETISKVTGLTNQEILNINKDN